jgi:ParB family chromosome partitioning protein
MTTTTETVRQLPIEAIVPDPANRKVVLDKQFVDSIRTHGVIQPLLVTPHAEKQGAFDLVAGHRRLAAARKVGLGAVPAIVRELTDQQKLELALVDNLQRADLSPSELGGIASDATFDTVKKPILQGIRGPAVCRSG